MSRLITLFTIGCLLLPGCAKDPEPGPTADQAPPAASPAPIETGSAEMGSTEATPENPGPESPAPQTSPEPADTPSTAAKENMKAPKADSPGSEPAEKSPAPAAAKVAADAVAKGSEMADVPSDSLAMYIGEDAIAAAVLTPESFLKNAVVKQIWDNLLQMEGSELARNMESMERNTGIRPEDVKRVLFVASQEDVPNITMFLPGAQPQMVRSQPTFIFEFVTPVAAQALYDSAPGGDNVDYSGRTGKVINNGETAVVLDDETRVVIGQPHRVEKLWTIEMPNSLTAHLDFSGKSHASGTVDIESLKPALAKMPFPNPAMAVVMGYVQQLTDVSLKASVDQPVFLSAEIGTVGEDSANAMQEMLAGFVQMGSQRFAEASAQASKTDPAQSLVPMVQGLIDSTKVATDKTAIHLTVPLPTDFDKLPELLKPALQQARSAAMTAGEKNNLKQIALAFHNYHDSYGRLPAMDSRGLPNEEERGEGLSWRVHLLPFLGEQALYDQFHLDERWDSEHNLTLVSQIPGFYANGEKEGTTTYHVVTGEGMPFQPGEDGPRFRDITDGTSNTILTVQGGPDTATIWTQPGGLKIDPEDPIAALGKIGETFLIGLMDGSVRQLSKKTDSLTLMYLFQHQDGNAVNEF
ncbi:MAG: DUF1559 domain-containing protein [Planctomycetaceae bacterium]|nr:DUF1559 domain-containing protein [Planctomycetaceae bacterium]